MERRRRGHRPFQGRGAVAPVAGPDPAADARHLLHRVLYAQVAYYKARGHWATRLAELRLTGAPFGGVHLETTRTSFEASTLDTQGRRWHINSDARIWLE